jgi:hypothetical protein
MLKNAQMQVELCEIPFAGGLEILCRERIYAFPAASKTKAWHPKLNVRLSSCPPPISLMVDHVLK